MESTKNQPTIFIIFGGTGDLNARKLAPALYNLFLDNWLPKQFAIIGTGRTKLTDDDFRKKLMDDINQFSRSGKVEKKKWDEFSANLFYQVSDINDSETYKEFGKTVEAKNKEWDTKANVIYYMAVSPNFFPIISTNISKAGLADPDHTRIVIEKPFGHDLETARELDTLLAGIYDEKQVYRIDHYLGKETVQNIMAFRFANSLF
jgi:glucose-6-phosphate 1-dehydrogenase